MKSSEVTHNEIYDRLANVEAKVDALGKSTKDVTEAFAAAQGAFKVLETLSRLAKPMLWVGGLVMAIALFVENYRAR